MDALQSSGYVVLRNFTRPEEWTDCFLCPKVHHGCIVNQLERCRKHLNVITGWNARISKFRASAACELTTSNATDAGALHRDIMNFGDEAPPIYTLVIYLDAAQLSVIPASHRTPHMSFWQTLTSKTVVQHMRGGDAILFHASLLHAGVFAHQEGDRRVVQCFDIYRTPKELHQWNHRLLHVWCPESSTNTARGEMLSKQMSSWVSKALSSFYVFRSGGGYGRLKLPSGYTIVSGESYRKRLPTHQMHAFYDANVYAPYPGAVLHDASATDVPALRSQLYHIRWVPPLLAQFLILGFAILAIPFLFRKALKHSTPVKKNLR